MTSLKILMIWTKDILVHYFSKDATRMLAFMWQIKQAPGDPASLKWTLGLNRLGQSTTLNMVWFSLFKLMKTYWL